MFKIQSGFDTITKTFRLPASMVEELELLADKNKLSLNSLVVQCLRYALDNLEEP